MPDSSAIPKPIFRPKGYVLPIDNEQAPTSNKKSFTKTVHNHPVLESTESIQSHQLYIPKEKPFFAVNKMFRTSTSQFPPTEEFSTSSSQSK